MKPRPPKVVTVETAGPEATGAPLVLSRQIGLAYLIYRRSRLPAEAVARAEQEATAAVDSLAVRLETALMAEPAPPAETYHWTMASRLIFMAPSAALAAMVAEAAIRILEAAESVLKPAVMVATVVPPAMRALWTWRWVISLLMKTSC
jgi:hypothetical protein